MKDKWIIYTVSLLLNMNVSAKLHGNQANRVVEDAVVEPEKTPEKKPAC